MQKTFQSIDGYIKTFPSGVQKVLQTVRKTIQKAAPESTESFSYGAPAFKLNGKNLILFAAFKHHLGIYPEPATIVAFKKELTKYKTSKGAIQFQFDEPMPYGLITKIVKFRVKELTH